MAVKLSEKMADFFFDVYDNYGGTWILTDAIISHHSITKQELDWSVANRYMNHRGTTYALTNKAIKLLNNISLDHPKNFENIINKYDAVVQDFLNEKF
jgi:hypothetical protein